MNVWKINHYSFNNEEKDTLRKARTIFDNLHGHLLYSANDYYKLDNFNLSQDDIKLICNALSALTEASDIITHNYKAD